MASARSRMIRMLCLLCIGFELVASVTQLTVISCGIQIDTRKDVINLEPLARRDGFPRYTTQFNFSNHLWYYSFNPCIDYDVPKDNPHVGFGDRCASVAVCKYTSERKKQYHYTMGVSASAHYSATDGSVTLVYSGIKSMRARETIIQLLCDEERQGAEDGLFVITRDIGQEPLKAELHHKCCCVGGCPIGEPLVGDNSQPSEKRQPKPGGNNSSRIPDSQTASTPVAIAPKKDSSDGEISAPGDVGNKTDPENVSKNTEQGSGKKADSLLIVVGLGVAVLMLVALIGGLCYVKRTHLQMYSKLPLKANSPGQGISLSTKTNFRDYEPASVKRKKLLPVLQDTMINRDSLDMFQRLGGGMYGDTHLAKWHDMTVAVKRLTLLVHENQITPEAMKLMKNEIWFLSRQRHRNIVTILGLCLDGKLPSIITECVVGECLKDFIKHQGRLLSWPHRVRICTQVANGMAFLHSTKPPIIHRDLRCGNLFLSDDDVVKVADFGLIKLLQPVREECPQDDCCCRRTLSACPASIRWTAPELLAHPTAKETLVPPVVDKSEIGSSELHQQQNHSQGPSKTVITPACDVFSFAMVMWELPMCQDPFAQVSEAEVQEIIQHGGRPETPPSADMMPQYKELMKLCWDQLPTHRPTFKQVASRLKDLESHARSYQKQLHNRQRVEKCQHSNSSLAV